MPTSARCWDSGRPSVGADDLTDAPNFGTEFGRRRPCPRYGGPLLGTTCDAPVGRGDHTPPPQIPFRNLAGGSHTPGAPRRRSPCSAPRWGNVRFPCQFPLSPERFPHRVGADLCVRPRTGPAKKPWPGRHIGRPLQILLKPPSAPGGAGGGKAPPLLVARQRTIRDAAPTKCLRATAPLTQGSPWGRGLSGVS